MGTFRLPVRWPFGEQPYDQLSKLLGFTACREALHAIGIWYKIVLIPLLVASENLYRNTRRL